jgi:predicted ester cyclase
MSTEQNKALVVTYNKEVIEKGNMEVLKQIASPDFINHSAPQGMPSGLDGMEYFFANILHTAFSDIEVGVEDMVADEHKVATRKVISGTHTGTLMDIAPSGKKVAINVIDILSITHGKITAHWGQNNFTEVVQSL